MARTTRTSRKSSGSGALTALLIGGAGLAAYALTRNASAATMGPTPTTGPAPTPPPTPRLPPRSTNAFDPAKAPRPAQAHALAVSFANAPDPTTCTNPADISTCQTYETIYTFGAVPSNRAAIAEFQSASGIDSDGIVGPQTEKAFNYFLSNAG